MMDAKANKRLRRLETALLASGVLLLAVFGAAVAWSQLQSQAAINAFEEARAATLDLRPSAQGLAQPAATAETTAFSGMAAPVRPERVSISGRTGEPDYTLWSELRIKEYRESLQVKDEDPQALLTIQRLDIHVPVYNGASDLNLNRGVGRIKGTGSFGLDGNLGIAGHRDGFFRGLKDIQVGDTMHLETLEGTTEFVVSSITIVDPSEVSVLAPTDTPSVTLVTCYPFYYVGHAPQRFIVKGEVKSQTVTS